jgi:hypothetical protein
VRRLTGGEGKVGKKVQELTADLEVAGIVEGKLEAAVRLDTEPARRGSEGSDGGPATGVQEGEGISSGGFSVEM